MTGTVVEATTSGFLVTLTHDCGFTVYEITDTHVDLLATITL